MTNEPSDEQCRAIARNVYKEQGRPSWLTMPIVPHDLRLIRAAYAAGRASVPRELPWPTSDGVQGASTDYYRGFSDGVQAVHDAGTGEWK